MLGSESHTLLLGPRKTGFCLLLTKGTCGGFSGGGMGAWDARLEGPVGGGVKSTDSSQLP